MKVMIKIGAPRYRSSAKFISACAIICLTVLLSVGWFRSYMTRDILALKIGNSLAFSVDSNRGELLFCYEKNIPPLLHFTGWTTDVAERPWLTNRFMGFGFAAVPKEVSEGYTGPYVSPGDRLRPIGLWGVMVPYYATVALGSILSLILFRLWSKRNASETKAGG